MNYFRLIAFVLILSIIEPLRAQMLINEVMHYPTTSQGLIGIGTEYLELFNSSPCLTADISCFIIGFADDDGGIVNNRGAIVLPAGTTIPPYGHYVIGTSSSSANPASVDFKTNLNTGNYCTVGNFVLANGDGWVGLYDASGVVVDALYWTVSAGEAAKITTDSDLDDNPCVPPTIAGCGGPVATLASPKQIYQTFPSRISYIGQYVNANTISRIPDGGTWTRAIAPSINDATVGNCNGGTCLVPVSIAFNATKTNPTCGNSNGSITMNVTSAGTVSYAWSANAATGNNATASGLAAGTYAVTMTQNGCTKDTTITLNSNSTLNVALTNPVNPTCAGGNGSITATLSGGTAPYVVTIDTGGTPFTINVPFAISQTLSNLPAGTINVSVADNAGCSASANATLTAPTNCCVYSLNATTIQPSCGNSNGSIAITIANGSGIFTYTWSANALTGNTATASALGAGSYSVSVTQNACSKDTTITLNSASSLAISLTNPVNPTCAGNNGSITANLSGGTAPYVVTIDTGGTPFTINVPFAISQTLSNLPAGSINVNVADNAGCSASANATLTAPTSCCVYSLNATTIQPSCGNSNGSIAITIANGSGTFTCTWSANALTGNTATASALGAGSYSVSVTQNACSKDTTITLNSASSLAISLTNPVNPTCAGNNGSITANLSGGTAPYVVTIDTGGTPFTINVPFAISQTLSNLPAGSINVNLADNAGCSASANATLTTPTNCCTVSLSAALVQPSCGNSDGNITCTAANGSGNYTYTWSANAATGNSPNAVNIGAGIYTLTLTDNGFANCFIDTGFTLTNPNAPVINAANVINETCTGMGDGSIAINASGGTGTLSYSWSANASTGNSSNAVNLGAGNYGFTVTDINNCQVVSSATVQSNICCTLQTGSSQTATTCGNNNGGISINILTAGTTPYTYSLNGGTAISSGNFTALAAGSYTIITTDFTGCADTLTTNVAPSNNTLVLSINPTDVTCFGFNDGSATTVINGGTPAYSYSWSTGSVNSALQNLTAGDYGLTITDQDNCTVTAATFINQPQALVINIGSDTIVCQNHPVVIDAGSGFASYAWSNSSTTQTITTQTNGFYEVTVTDNNGCTATDGLNINSNSANAVELGNDITIYSGESAGLNALVISAVGGSFIWSPVDFLSCMDCQNTVASPSNSIMYTVFYTDAIGCVSKDSVHVEVVSVGDAFFPTAFSPNGDGNNDVYRASCKGIKQFRLGIYNRWGEKVFESNNFLDGWDGVYQSVNQPMGVYVYTATVVLLNNQTRDYKGSITLIR